MPTVGSAASSAPLGTESTQCLSSGSSCSRPTLSNQNAFELTTQVFWSFITHGTCKVTTMCKTANSTKHKAQHSRTSNILTNPATSCNAWSKRPCKNLKGSRGSELIDVFWLRRNQALDVSPAGSENGQLPPGQRWNSIETACNLALIDHCTTCE